MFRRLIEIPNTEKWWHVDRWLLKAVGIDDIIRSFRNSLKRERPNYDDYAPIIELIEASTKFLLKPKSTAIILIGFHLSSLNAISIMLMHRSTNIVVYWGRNPFNLGKNTAINRIRATLQRCELWSWENVNDSRRKNRLHTWLDAHSEFFCCFLLILSPLYANKNENSNCAAADKKQQSSPAWYKPHLVRWATLSP